MSRKYIVRVFNKNTRTQTFEVGPIAATTVVDLIMNMDETLDDAHTHVVQEADQDLVIAVRGCTGETGGKEKEKNGLRDCKIAFPVLRTTNPSYGFYGTIITTDHEGRRIIDPNSVWGIAQTYMRRANIDGIDARIYLDSVAGRRLAHHVNNAVLNSNFRTYGILKRSKLSLSDAVYRGMQTAGLIKSDPVRDLWLIVSSSVNNFRAIYHADIVSKSADNGTEVVHPPSY